MTLIFLPSASRYVCENTDAPAATKSNYGKNLNLLYFNPAPPPGHMMSVLCGQPVDELTTELWSIVSLYHHPNLVIVSLSKFCYYISSSKLEIYITLCVELRIKRRTIRLQASMPEALKKGVTFGWFYFYFWWRDGDIVIAPSRYCVIVIQVDGTMAR